MANWKKVIVSGSNAHLNHITASGNISASGFLFGNLPESDLNQVVIYNTTTGRLEFKTLDLVSTTAAPNLFIADIGGYSGVGIGDAYSESDGEETDFDFVLSYDTGSSGGGPQVPMTTISASTSGSHVETADSTWYGINDVVLDVNLSNNDDFFNPGADPALTDDTPPTDVLHGLIPGPDKIAIPIRIQGFDDDAVPKFPTGFPYANYQAGAFNDGGIGELRVYVNQNDRSNPNATLDLEAYPGPVSSTAFGDNIGFYFSATSSNFSTDGSPDNNKHHRSGSGAHTNNNGDIIIPAALQNDGFNYCYILHTGSKDGTDFGYITNFVQWFYDLNGAGQAITEVDSGLINLDAFAPSETSSISGIKFYSGSAANNVTYQYGISVNNQYNAVYRDGIDGIYVSGISTNTIDNFAITQSAIDGVAADTYAGPTGNAFLGKALGSLSSVAAASASKTVVTMSADIVFPLNEFHQPSDFDDTAAPGAFVLLEGLSDNADITAGSVLFRSVHTSHKADKTVGVTGINDFLLNTLTSNSDENYFEDFKREEFRLENVSYNGVTNPSQSQYFWDGEKSVTDGGTGYNGSLIQYYTHLMYPGVFSGDDVTRGDYDTTYGPVQQNDYSSATGERVYIRYFKILTADQGGNNFNIEFVGSGSIVAGDNTTEYSGASFKVAVRRTGGGASSALNGDWVDQSDTSYGYTQGTTGKIPVTEDYTDIDYSNQANQLPVGVIKIADNAGDAFAGGEYIMVKITAPSGWTGYINAIGVTINNIGSGGSVVLGQSGYTSL